MNHKIIKDSVHGLIELKPIIVKIIDTPEFQRLRNIKQLESLCYIYPCAVHNRFEHSIGTSYLARLFIKHISKIQPELGITEKEELCVEIAGLCHDLGHGPFSHLFEDASKKIFQKHQSQNSGFAHEHVSLLVFDRIYEKLKKDFNEVKLDEKCKELIKELINPTLIKDLIELYKIKKDNEESIKIFEQKLGIPIEKSFLFEIVSNVRNKIDVDKWDYFARDSLNLGISNTFDYKRFIYSSRIINPDNTLNQICVRDKELRNVYEMFRTREDLHRRAYQLPKAIGVKQMIIDILFELDDIFDFYDILSKLKTDQEALEKYLDMDDRIICITQKSFERFFKNQSLPDSFNNAKNLINRLNTRNLYKEISKKIVENERYDIVEMEESLINGENNIKKDDFFIAESIINFGCKSEDPLKNLEFFDKESKIVDKNLIEDFNSRMKPQHFQEVRLILFVKELSIIDDPSIIKNLKQSFENFFTN